MSNNIFKRIEQKYLLTKEQKDLFLKEIENYIEPDEYPTSKIYTIYFDSKNDYLINKSLEKPTFKYKLRARSYDLATSDSNIFFEIKSKYKGTVGKRRIKLKYNEFLEYLEEGKIKKDKEIMKEIDYLIKLNSLKPRLLMAYDRVSYKGSDRKYLRITLDSNLRSRYSNLDLSTEKGNKKFFDKDVYIMEIKTLDSLPLWLVEILSKNKLYPTSFSKYGSIYNREMK